MRVTFSFTSQPKLQALSKLRCRKRRTRCSDRSTCLRFQCPDENMRSRLPHLRRLAELSRCSGLPCRRELKNYFRVATRSGLVTLLAAFDLREMREIFVNGLRGHFSRA